MPDQFSPPRGPRVAVQRDYMFGVSITLALDYGGETIRTLHFGENGAQEWRDHNRFESIDEPTLRIQEELARELYAELGRFFRGEPDNTASRLDYLHERGRVDKLLDRLSDLAVRSQELHIHKAEQ
jgi:hypothetical protein